MHDDGDVLAIIFIPTWKVFSIIESNVLESKRIRIMCPSCYKTGTIMVERGVIREDMQQHADGMIKVHVFAGEICEHEFSVNLDVNFKVR